MPLRSLSIVAVLLCAATAPVAAQERPRYIPTRDAVVQYALTSSQPGAPAGVVAHVSSGGRVRLETSDHGTLLYALGTPRALWLLPQSNLAIDLPVGQSLAGTFLPGANAEFRRIGRDSVAGLACTTWHVTVQRGSGTACVTGDGVILRAEGTDARGHSGSVVATSVSFEPQPAALFEPPPGSQRIAFPQAAAPPRTVRP